MRIIDLSHTITDGMAQYPGDDLPPRIIRQLNHAEHGHQSSRMEIGCHVGTHIDTPCHFRDGQPGLEAMPAEVFAGRARVLDAPAGDPPGALSAAILTGCDLATIDFLLLRTGWEHQWARPRYYQCWPYLDPHLADLLAAAGLKGVGLDSPSIDPLGGRAAHEKLAAARLINVENLANLEALPAETFDFLALPLKLAGTEGSPVRAVALV